MSVSLTKGQKVSLAKEGAGLTRIVMGLGWDVAKKGGFLKALFSRPQEVDLDASCLVFDSDGKLADAVFYNNLRAKGGAIVHTGDNRTGAGDGDDESIVVDLAALPATVKALVFVVSSYQGHTFDQIDNAYCRVIDQAASKELMRFDISEAGGHTGLVMAKIYRHCGEWKVHAIGEKARAKTPGDFVPVVAPLV